MRTSATGAGAQPSSRAGGPNTVVAVLAFAGIVVALMQTLVIPLVPELPKLLNASAADAAWVVTATLLASAVATPTAGRLGDMYGKRRVVLASLVLLVLGSVLAALSDSLALVVVGRALQGTATGVIALGISIMRDELPPERLGSGTALMSASLGVGGALGLPLAAFLAERADWHVLFWGAAGFGVLAFILVVLLVPESPLRTGGRFDVVGAAGLSVALACLLLAISMGTDWGWTSGAILGLFGAVVVLLPLWGWWELRTPAPLVDLRTAVRRQVLLTNVASVIFGFAMFAVSLVIPQLAQLPDSLDYGMGGTMLLAGLIMAPNGLMMMAMAPVSGRLSRTRGPKVTLMLGAVVVAVGYGLGIGLMTEIWQLVLFSCVIGAGVGLAYGAMPMLIMGAVPVSETAAANSFNTLLRSLGTSTASTVTGLLLAEMTLRVGPAAVPSQDGFRVVLAIGAGAAVVAFGIAAFLRGVRTQGADTTADEACDPDEQGSRALRGTVTGGTVTGGTGVVSVTAHHADGAIAATTTVDAAGRYHLAGLPREPLTLVATEHPAVQETVTVAPGHSKRHDIAIPVPPAQESVAGKERA